MNEIINNVMEKELKYKGSTILKYKIEYPQIKNTTYPYGINRFNTFNRIHALELKLYAERNLFKDAKQTYEYNIANGYPIMVYELILSYTITYNNDNILSLYSDEYIFSSGAHGSTIRSSQNWNLRTGEEFNLQSVFANNPNYVLYILKEINNDIKEQIENGSNQYFDNYCELVINSLNLDNFYLYNDDVIIFFQQYDIAPYSSGIPTFTIPR